ncbi:MAG: hypothetical protein ACTSWN_06025, partial [Promethearchaeota archaeon]
QPVFFLIAIKIFIGFIPGIAMICGALILVWYPLKGEYLKNIKEKMLIMHSEKAKKLAEQEKTMHDKQRKL